MRDDPNKVKFFAYLNLFAAAMLCLVTAGNYIVMFLGWEAVGLASYLLINFWFTRNLANQSAIKAIIYNRVGDIFFISAIALSFSIFKTTDFRLIDLILPELEYKSITLFTFSVSSIEILGLFLFLAAAAKSAQLILHAWLPDAMEGPTPVSALLHSATMVTAGVFLILRSTMSFLQQLIFHHYCSIGFSYGNSIFLIGLMQYDIKRIIAYSTCSQLGFMMFSVVLVIILLLCFI